MNTVRIDWKRMTVIVLAAGLTVALGWTDVWARTYPSLHRGIRPLGMGGAFTAVADDENALFYNPAGLARMDNVVRVGILNPLIEASGRSMSMLMDMADTDMNRTSEVAELLRKYVNDHHYFRTSLAPFVGFNLMNIGMMAGGLLKYDYAAEIRNQAWPEVYLDSNTDMGLLYGAGVKLPFTGLHGGAAVKVLNRNSLNGIYTATEIAASNFDDRLDDDTKSGSGMGFDMGLMYDMSFIPLVDASMGLAILNVPRMDMGDAAEIKTTVNLGCAVDIEFTGFHVLVAADLHDVTKAHDSDEDWGKRLHAGAEVRLPLMFSARLGIHQGYMSAGATVDFALIKIDLATYGEEVGAYSGQREDRRYLGQVSVGW